MTRSRVGNKYPICGAIFRSYLILPLPRPALRGEGRGEGRLPYSPPRGDVRSLALGW
jgi:hypothetical protein